MKKLVIALCLITLLVSATLVILISKLNLCSKPESSKVKVPFSPFLPGITLNGIKSDLAEKQVNNFLKDNTSSHYKTAMWLSKKWVDSITTLLVNEKKAGIGTDGIRIYFAKYDNGANTAVFVSTKNDGADPKAESLNDHSNYFDHNSQFLGTAGNGAIDPDAALKEDYIGESGATLYTQKTSPVDYCSTTTYNYISWDEAASSVSNFVLRGAHQGINIESEWFPIELFQSLQAELDYAVDVAKVKADGIRIYFAMHDENAKNPLHKNRHGLIIVTTKIDDKTLVPRQDYYNCYNPNPSVPMVKANDNGEMCPNSCNL